MLVRSRVGVQVRVTRPRVFVVAFPVLVACDEIKNDQVSAVTGAGANDYLQDWLNNMMRELDRQNRHAGDPFTV